MSSKMTGKEILLAYINTLSDAECTNLYFIIKEIEEPSEYLYFDKDGELISYDQAQEQYHIKLTRKQYNALMGRWTIDKFKNCVKILSIHNEPKNWIFEYGVFRILTGWVEREYNRLVQYHYIDTGKERDFVKPFTELDTKEEAERWISTIAPEIRNKSPYVFYLRNKFNIGEI